MTNTNRKYDVNKLLYESGMPSVVDPYNYGEEKGINPGYTLICDKEGNLTEGNLGLPVDVPMIFALSTNGLALGVKNYAGLMDKPRDIFNIGPYEICPMSDLKDNHSEMKAGRVYIKPITDGFEYIKVGMKEPKKIISTQVNLAKVQNNEKLKLVEKRIILDIKKEEKIHLSTDKSRYLDPEDRYGHPSLTRKDYTLRLISELEMSQYKSGEKNINR